MKKLLVVFIVTISLYASITIDSSEHFKLNLEENLFISGNLHIQDSAKFTAREDSSINLDRDWINEGNFTSSTSTVNLIGANKSIVYGNNIFYNFTSTKDTTFESNKTQEVTNTFILKNADINSTITGVQSIINLATIDEINTTSLTIQDSKVIGRAAAINPTNSTDSGNNIMWFNQNIDCHNIGSGYQWHDRLTCEDSSVTYLTSDSTLVSKAIFDENLNVVATPIETNTTGEKNRVKLQYQSPLDIGSGCSNDIEVVLNEDATVKTGYKDCVHEYPTLKNWSEFKDAKVLIQNNSTGTSHTAIVIDVNLTSALVIGGSL